MGQGDDLTAKGRHRQDPSGGPAGTAPDPVNTVAMLEEIYRTAVERVLRGALKGGALNLGQERVTNEEQLGLRNRQYVGVIDHHDRVAAVGGLLFQELKALSVANPSRFEATRDLPDESLLRQVHKSLTALGGIGSASRDDFVSSFTEMVYKMSLHGTSLMLRRLAYVTALNNFPEEERLDIPNAVHMPESALSPKGLKKSDLLNRLAIRTAAVFEAPELAPILDGISALLTRDSQGKGARAGKHYIPKGILFKFTDPAQAEAELDRLFEGPERKQLLLSAAFEYQAMLGAAVRVTEGPWKPESNEKKRMFACDFADLSFAEAGKIRSACALYGSNQILYVWQQAGVIPNPTPHFASTMGLTATADDSGLYIHQLSRKVGPYRTDSMINISENLAWIAAVAARARTNALARIAEHGLSQTE